MTHYQALELPEQATAADIRRAYRRLVLLTHPDRTPDPAAHARYLAINAAYEVLSEPSRRQAYNNVLHYQAPSPAASSQTRRPQPHPRNNYRAATKSASYTAHYLHYAPLGKSVCKALLIFSLLLIIDRMWITNFSHERVLKSTQFSSKKGSYCVKETTNATFRGGPCFRVGDLLALRRTALFGQVISVSPTIENKETLIEDYWDISFLYTSGGALFPIAMFVTALVGAWPGPVGRRQVDCAMTAGLLAVIVIWLLATA